MRRQKNSNKALSIPEDYDGSTPLPNARWEAFCIAYTGEFRGNAAASYRAAGYKTKKTVSDKVNAAKLLTFTNLQKRVKHLNDEAMAAIKENGRESLERLALIATVSYSDFLDEFGQVDIRKVRDPRLAPAVKRCTPIRDKEGCIVDYYLELYDAMKAPELLGFTEKTQESTDPVTQVLVIKT